MRWWKPAFCRAHHRNCVDPHRQRRLAIEKAIAEKVARHAAPLESLTFTYGNSKVGTAWRRPRLRVCLAMSSACVGLVVLTRVIAWHRARHGRQWRTGS